MPKNEAIARIEYAFEHQTSMPYINHLGQYKYQSFHAAVSDLICEDKLVDQLVKVLRNSQCPHVALLKRALVDRYIDQWSDDLAYEIENCNA